MENLNSNQLAPEINKLIKLGIIEVAKETSFCEKCKNRRFENDKASTTL